MVDISIPPHCAPAQSSFFSAFTLQAKPLSASSAVKKSLTTRHFHQYKSSVNCELVWPLVGMMAGLEMLSGEEQESV